MASAKLRKEARGILGGFYAQNVPKRIGYLFSEHIDGGIARGMFCDRSSEIDHNQWDYFMDMKGITYTLTLRKAKSLRDFYDKNF